MSATHYDYIVVGRWRNRDMVNDVVARLRSKGKTVYCFTESEYDADGIKFEKDPAAKPEEMMAKIESVTNWQTNPTFRRIFEADMGAERNADALVLVFPAGLSAHMELGAAYGMGKKCYGVGTPEKVETLYMMFDKLFPDAEAMQKELA